MFGNPPDPTLGVLLKRGTENGTEYGTERNGKRNETEKEMKVSKENKYVHFVDTIAYEGKRFELKQNLNSDIRKRNINFQYFDLTRVHNPSVFKGVTIGKQFVI